MSWSRAALLAIGPWLFLVAACFGITAWEGLPEWYGWPGYLWRLGKVAVLLYVACAAALHFRVQPVEKPE